MQTSKTPFTNNSCYPFFPFPSNSFLLLTLGSHSLNSNLLLPIKYDKITKAIDIYSEDANDLYMNRQKGLKEVNLPQRKRKCSLPTSTLSPSPLVTLKPQKKRVSVGYVVENNVFGEEETFCGQPLRETKAIVTSQSCSFYCLKMIDFTQIMVKRFTADHIARIKSETLRHKIIYRQEQLSKVIEVNQIYADFTSRLEEENLIKQKRTRKLLFEGKRLASSSHTTQTSTPRSPRKQSDKSNLTSDLITSKQIDKHSSQQQLDLFCITSPPQDELLIPPQFDQSQPNYQNFASLNTDPQQPKDKSISSSTFVCPPQMDLEKLNIFYSPRKKRKAINPTQPTPSSQKQQQKQVHAIQPKLSIEFLLQQEKDKAEKDMIKKSTILSGSQKNLLLLSMNKEKKMNESAAKTAIRSSQGRPRTATASTTTTTRKNNKLRQQSEDQLHIQAQQKRETNPLWNSLYISKKNITEHKTLQTQITYEVIERSSNLKSHRPSKRRPVSATQNHCVSSSILEKKGKHSQEQQKKQDNSNKRDSMFDIYLDSKSPPLSDCDEVEMTLLKNLVVNYAIHKDTPPIKHGLEQNWAFVINNCSQTTYQPSSILSSRRPSTAGRMRRATTSDSSESSPHIPLQNPARINSSLTAKRPKQDNGIAATKDWNDAASDEVRKKQAQVLASQTRATSGINSTPPVNSSNSSSLITSQISLKPQKPLEQQSISSEGFSKKRAGSFNAGKYYLNGKQQQKYYFNLRKKVSQDTQDSLISFGINVTSSSTNSKPISYPVEQISRRQSTDLSDTLLTTVTRGSVTAGVVDEAELEKQKQALKEKQKGDQLDQFKSFIRRHLYSS